MNRFLMFCIVAAAVLSLCACGNVMMDHLTELLRLKLVFPF